MAMAMVFKLAAVFGLTILIASCSCGDDDDDHGSDDDDTDDDTEDDDGDDDFDDDGDDDTQPSPRPNLIVIMTDDLDEGALDLLLEGDYMPNLQTRIIEPGFDFRESFVTNPVCCPSRATFLSGQYSHNNDVWTNNLPFGGVTRFDHDDTLATWLHGAGYRTGIVGKYLNGYGGQSDPFIPAGWDDWQVLIDPSTYDIYDYQLNDNGTIVEYGDAPEDYQTDVLAGRAVDFIEESEGGDAPFFLWVTPLAPHVEFPEGWETQEPTFSAWYELMIRPAPRHEGLIDVDLFDDPSFNEADMSDKPGFLQTRPPLTSEDISNVRRQYNSVLGSMLAVDDLIGEVLDALDATGEAENTVVIFTSDNGFLYGRHLIPQKNAVYEESIRVPLYVRAPGYAPGSTDHMVTNNDFAPTLAEFASATPTRAVDGRSWISLLEDPTLDDWRKRTYIQHWSTTNTYAEVNTFSAVRTGKGAPEGEDLVLAEYRILLWPTDIEFYDIGADPYQLDSAHEDPAYETERETLGAFIEAFQECSGDACRALEDADEPPANR